MCERRRPADPQNNGAALRSCQLLQDLRVVWEVRRANILNAAGHVAAVLATCSVVHVCRTIT
eukprot:scaffold455466_cov51-Prasinocladus_malaysianus.AAC.1